MPFPRELSRSETQPASYKIWTWITDFISSDENRNSGGTLQSRVGYVSEFDRIFNPIVVWKI